MICFVVEMSSREMKSSRRRCEERPRLSPLAVVSPLPLPDSKVVVVDLTVACPAGHLELSLMKFSVACNTLLYFTTCSCPGGRQGIRYPGKRCRTAAGGFGEEERRLPGAGEPLRRHLRGRFRRIVHRTRSERVSEWTQRLRRSTKLFGPLERKTQSG